jgi:hypothetical protein
MYQIQVMSAYKEYLLSVWESRLKHYGYGSADTPKREQQELRFARIGLVVAISLIAFMGISELVFVGLLIWQLLW